MSLTFRTYLFEEARLRRVPRRVAEAMPFGNDSIPEYANSRQRVAEVIVESEDRKPVRILDVIGCYWEFDAEGKIEESFRNASAEWMELAFAHPRTKKSGTIVDLVPEIKKKDLHDRHRWTLTREDLDRIAADLWPGVNGPALEVTSVKGAAPKKPPLTREAEKALSEISMKLMSIKFELDRLTEPALRGLEFEARRTSTYEDPALWIGVADTVKQQRDLLVARRTGKGEWYAVIEAMRSEGPMIMKSIAIAHEKCKSQVDAVLAGQRLMAEKAAWLAPDIRIDVVIYSALEWQPEGD